MRVIFRSPEFTRAVKSPGCSEPAKMGLLNCCDRMALERKTEKMPNSQKDQLAAEAVDRWEDFQESLPQ
jgi:hypothetical protein